MAHRCRTTGAGNRSGNPARVGPNSRETDRRADLMEPEIDGTDRATGEEQRSRAATWRNGEPGNWGRRALEAVRYADLGNRRGVQER